MTSEKRLKQLIDAQRKRRQPEKDRRVCAAFRELMDRKSKVLNISNERLDDYFKEITAIIKSEAYGKWVARALPIESRKALIESITDYSYSEEIISLHKQLYSTNLAEHEQFNRMSQLVGKYGSYVSKRLSDSLGADYRRLLHRDVRALVDKLGIREVELGTEIPHEWRKISNVKIRRICMEIVKARETDAKDFTDVVNACRRGRTRKLLLKIEGYSRAHFSQFSKLRLLRWLKKRKLIIWQESKKKTPAKLTDKGKRVVAELLKKGG